MFIPNLQYTATAGVMVDNIIFSDLIVAPSPSIQLSTVLKKSSFGCVRELCFVRGSMRSVTLFVMVAVGPIRWTAHHPPPHSFRMGDAPNTHVSSLDAHSDDEEMLPWTCQVR